MSIAITFSVYALRDMIWLKIRFHGNQSINYVLVDVEIIKWEIDNFVPFRESDLKNDSDDIDTGPALECISLVEKERWK